MLLFLQIRVFNGNDKFLKLNCLVVARYPLNHRNSIYITKKLKKLFVNN